MQLPKSQERRWAVSLVLLLTLGGGCLPEDTNTTEANAKGKTTMAADEFKLQEAIQRCRRGTPTDINQLFTDLRDKAFLMALDGSEPYDGRRTPPQLAELLQHIGVMTTPPDIPDRLVTLGKAKEYSADDPEGSLRRKALIQAMGFVTKPPHPLIIFLDTELSVAEGRYRSTAVSSLARLGTPETVSVLRKRIYQKGTSLLSEQTRAVYLRNYTVELAQYRDRPAVMTLLVTDLFAQDELKRTVLECLVEDVVALGADPCFQFQMAALTSQTAEAVNLAQTLATWCIQEGQVIAFLKALPNIAQRITDLLGQPATIPEAGGPDVVKTWAHGVFSQARDVEKDPARRQHIEMALAQLP